MAAFLFLMLTTLSMLSASEAAWCVCRSDMSSNVLQKALDYACGAGADCSPITQNGACYNPNTVLAHCSYAVNSYYQRKGQAQGACDFSGSATLSSTDPGSNGCAYPASSSAAGSSGIPTTTPPSNTPTSTTPTSTTPTGTTLSPPTSLTPPTFNPNTGTGTGTGTSTGTGGVLGGLGPSGTTSSFDSSGGTVLLPSPNVASFFMTLLLSSLFLARI
ncbi:PLASMODESMATA CALLOSE-BINDING PROTEIN 2-like [Curcuma longa]|uniref:PLASMODESMATA CALLOSE-BINDING PROTEIN 2-like n=1 Tax=Curcuma longa TaxID=136217 RepID=UPI003D9E9650